MSHRSVTLSVLSDKVISDQTMCNRTISDVPVGLRAKNVYTGIYVLWLGPRGEGRAELL